MESGSNSLSSLVPLVFDGENYQAWAIRMQAYMEDCDYWEVIEQDYEIAPLPDNPTIYQIKTHKERVTRKEKARVCLYVAVSPAIFNRIMALKSKKEIWEFLKSEYEGDERIKGMKVLNLVREFERMQMKDYKSIKEYSDKLIGIANKARALGIDLSDNRLVIEVVSALQAQEQTRLIRQEGSIEGALKARVPQGEGRREKKGSGSSSSESAIKDAGSTCKHCGKQNHPHFRCWRRPNVKCRSCHLLGHIERLFTQCDGWLVDSGCTNHMTNDKELFKDIDKSFKPRVKIGNGEYLEVKGKTTVSIESCAGIKLITKVLFVPEIDQNLLSVGQLVEKGFKVLFEEEKCLISDSNGNELFKIKMQHKIFSLDSLEKE
ncbi:uncharacterized protein LOC120079069 [Benincasa hispida]|uniref:uncharacterized protein LOC120079069 n=1 Tax=Benincasa hispida TaxID=102211 RepID=UPI001900E36E|nr:uncharacterized protein LOC120079069 [Benincasa hispida]